MTPGEFSAWMDGFLDGKEKLTKNDIAKIKAKSASVSYPYYYPYASPWNTYPNGSITLRGGVSDCVSRTVSPSDRGDVAQTVFAAFDRAGFGPDSTAFYMSEIVGAPSDGK